MKKVLFLCLISSLIGVGCAALKQAKTSKERPPNIILIMADDMGYECLSSNGSTSYSTPILDGLAKKGIQFTNAISQPLCTPSRVKIMTGQYNYRNYEYFTYLNPNQPTFGNVLKEAGYATCIVGKWQLNGLQQKRPGFEDATRPHQFGFDEYALWQLTKSKKYGERFANPLIEQNGKLLPRDENAYGPDIVSNYAIDFIKRKKDQPFFIYYPMLLVHNPFVPTPDSKEWADPATRSKKDTAFFKDMVEYTDKIVGRIVATLEEQGVANNTLIIFTGDNGTNVNITSATKTGNIRGAKGNTINAGTHVPLVMSWPAKIKNNRIYDGLIGFSDFFATFAAIAGKEAPTDGKSFLPLLTGKNHQKRANVFVHYDPQWSKNVNQYRNQFARTEQYKLYQSGLFYDVSKDPLEEHPMTEQDLSVQELEVKKQLAAAIAKAPKWN